MNKITKLGLSALCGSLAAVTAAYAGPIDVTGSANATWLKKGQGDTGNPLGQKTSLSFKGSGELDGGQTFTATMDLNDKAAWSASQLQLVTNSMGTFELNNGFGGGIGSYDDNMPSAFEEVWDTGTTTGVDLAKGLASSAHIQWTSPSFAGSKLIVAWAPKNDATTANDKASSSADSNKDQAFDIVLDMSPELAAGAVNIFAGYSYTDTPSVNAGTSVQNRAGEHQEGTAGLKLTIGPVEAGYQKTVENPGNELVGETAFYDSTSWGVAFNINDNLSVSYGYFDSQRTFVNPAANESVEMAGNSMQASYTMGGATIAIAESEMDNSAYSTAAGKDLSSTLISLTMAF